MENTIKEKDSVKLPCNRIGVVVEIKMSKAHVIFDKNHKTNTFGDWYDLSELKFHQSQADRQKEFSNNRYWYINKYWDI